MRKPKLVIGHLMSDQLSALTETIGESVLYKLTIAETFTNYDQHKFNCYALKAHKPIGKCRRK